MEKIKKILLILPLAMSFFFIAPKASYPESAYEVPWSESYYYGIFNHNGVTLALVGDAKLYKSDTNTTIGFRYWNNVKQLYHWNGNNWLPIYGGNTESSAGVVIALSGYTGYSDLNNLIFSNHDITPKSSSAIVFPKALFQLQLTPAQERERATQEALTQAGVSISAVFGEILPMLLIMFSVVLGVLLVKRLMGLVVR